MSQDIKPLLDAAALATPLTTIVGWLPPHAALVTIVSTGFRIWETKTVQSWGEGRNKPDPP